MATPAMGTEAIILDNGAQDAYTKISLKERFGYAIGDFSTNIIWTAITTFLTFFYTDIVGISAGIVGTILLVTRLLDGVADVGIGALVDRTKSKHGKARPWIKWMAVPFGLSVMILFTAPELGHTGAIVYASLTYFIVSLIYSSINIPYGALNSLMTQDPYQRSLLSITRMVLGISGGVLISFFAMPMINTFGGGKMGWFLTFVIIGVISPLLYAITYKTTKERVKPIVVQKAIPFRVGFKALLRNKFWLIVIPFSTLIFLSSGVSGALNIYYAQYILHNPALVGALSLAGLVPIVVGMIISTPLIKKVGKRNAALIGACISLVGSLLILIDPTSFQVIMISTILKTLGIAPAVATGAAMLADTVDYGEWKTGVRTEGLIYSGHSVASKVGSGLGGAVVGWTLAFGGYVGGLEVQSDMALLSIKNLFIYVPMVLAILQIVLMSIYSLDKKYPAIMAELQALANDKKA